MGIISISKKDLKVQYLNIKALKMLKIKKDNKVTKNILNNIQVNFYSEPKVKIINDLTS